MCQFETPVFIYYSYIAVFFLSLVTAFIILYRNKSNPVNRNAFYFILIIAFWILNDLFQWIVPDWKLNMLSARISYLANFIVLFYLYFSYHFTYTPITAKKKFLLAIPFIISGLITLFSDFHFVISDFNLESCDYIPGKNIFITYFLQVTYAILATRILWKRYKDNVADLIAKSQIKVLISAIWFFVIWCIIYEEIGKWTYFSDSFMEISPHFVIGNLFFVSLIGFAMIKKNLFGGAGILKTGLVVFIWSAIFFGMFVFGTNIFVTIMTVIFYIILMKLFIED